MNKKAAKKKAPAKRKYVKRAIVNTQQVKPFEIEANPPSFRLNPDLQNVLKRIEETIKILKPGQAFVVPSKSRHSIKKFIEENWPQRKFLYSIIKDNTGMMRIYFLKRFDA